MEELRRDPSVLNDLGLTEVADHYEQTIRALRGAPILMGHSFGGALVQILLDRGLGSAGVAIDPAPVKGVYRLPLSSLRASSPVLLNPANRRRTVGLTPKQFHYAFTNTLTVDESQAVYDRYHVPTPGRPLFQAATANFAPHAATKVNFRNDDRAPLLIVGGGADHTVPASISRENYKRYHKSNATTAYKEFPGRSHWTIGQPGWEEVADYALDWATRNAQSQPPAV